MKLRMHGDGRHGYIPWGLGAVSVSISYVIIGQLTYCLTDSYGMAGTTVGLIMLISRIFDGITDVIAGVIIDRCHFKLGKARPFELFNIPMWIALMFCFEVPALNGFAKVLYIFLMYNLCQSVCFTFVSVSQTVRLKRTFAEDCRAKAITVSALISAVASTIFGILTPILISMFEDQPHGWLIITAFFAVPGMILTLCLFFLVPEMDNAEEVNISRTEKTGLLESFKLLLKNPYIFLIIIMVMTNTLANGINSAAGTYYFTYNIGNLMLSSVVGLFALVGYVFLLVLPVMTKKLGNRKSMMVSYAMVVLGNLAKLVMPLNVIWLVVCNVASIIGITIAMSARDMVIIDSMRYGELKTGKSCEGIYASVRGFSDKIATGLVGFITGIVLDLGHFDSSLPVQPDSALTAFTALYAVIPAVIAAIGFIAMYFCKMEDKIKEMEQKKLDEQAQ